MSHQNDGQFELVWERITAHAGERFATKTGLPFTYQVHGDSVVPDRTRYRLHASNFRKAHALLSLSGPGEINALVRGPAYVWAVLTDRRIQP
jgi:hypothetical protein